MEEEEEQHPNVKSLSISDLLRQSHPLTATSSLQSSTPRHLRPPKAQPHQPQNPNPNPKFLTSLSYPAVLIGTLTLPTTHETSSTIATPCPNNNTCFRFADSTSSVCCDMIGFRVSVLGKRIQVKAFNFIPYGGGGFLEIIKWGFVDFNDGIGDSSRVSSVPLFDASFCDEKDCHKARYSVWGVVGSVSPISVVPCSIESSSSSDSASSIKGFLVELLSCDCELCNSVNAWKKVVEDSVDLNESCHAFSRPVFVYFCGGPSSCWHPAMTKLIGNVIALSGLRKKLIFLGKDDESQLMFVTSKKSLLHYAQNGRKWLPKGKKSLEGNGECGIYTGMIKGVYIRGMVVELDNEVWLLLTDKQLLLPHCLRIGAIMSVVNVHFVRTKFSRTKLLILGSCLKTSIIIESFSPFETRCNVIPQKHSHLEDFISKLSYSARLWVLLTVSCFLQKFTGIVTEKEILGSKNKKGLSQIYATSHLPPSAFRPRHGLFKEFCAHASCGCGLEPYGDLRLVVPISIFFQYCELTWERMSLELENTSQITVGCSKRGHIYPQEGGSYCSPVRKFILSEEIGVILSGSLKICPSSGRLQLVDATGGVDILIPYLQPTWNSSSIYEVSDYHIIMEGRPYRAVGTKQPDDELYSCRRILNYTSPKRDMSLNIFVYFHPRNTPCRNFFLHSCEDVKGSKFEPGSWMLHILRVTHKFPVLHKLAGDVVEPKMSSMFVEATVLPWNLFIDVNEELIHFPATKQTVEASECWGTNWEFLPNKRFKVDMKSNSACLSNVGDSGLCPSSCSSVNECSGLCGTGSFEMPCLVTVIGIDKGDVVYSGVLSSREATVKTAHNCQPSLRKILLEFESSDAFNFQMLRIGAYYVVKHLREDCFCEIENSACVFGAKIFTNSRTKLYGLRFFAGDDIIKDSCSESELGTRDVQVNETKKNQSRLCGINTLVAFPEVDLHVSSHAMCRLEADLLELDRVFAKPTVNPEELATPSPCSGISEMPCPSPISNSSVYLFPAGNLMSIQGDVIGVHSLSGGSCDMHVTQASSSGSYLRRNICRDSSSISIHLLMGNCTVKIVGSVRQCALPVGFGPGINATFYRMLKLSMQKMFLLTPASFVVTNSIMTNNLCDVKLTMQPTSNGASAPDMTSGFIFGLKHYRESSLLHFRCRVVALHALILEKGAKEPKCLQPKSCCPSPIVEIPLAGFTVEDGSSSCFVWANAEQAATLLRLHEKLPETALKSQHWTVKWVKMDSSGHGTSAYYIDKILKKHKKIVMKNFGSMVDSSLQDLTFSLGTENNLSNLEEDLLKYMVLNACSSNYWIIVGARLESVAVHDIKKQHFLEMDMESDSFQHIWVREIRPICPLEEARRTVQELLKNQTG